MRLRVSVISAALMLLTTFAYTADTSVLKPPPGVKVAIVEFLDLQCPDCANANPLIEEASKTYNIPVVRYDFPLTKHNWSHQAAVIAKYFDSQSKSLGAAWRAYCFENQPAITPENLRSYADKFSAANKTSLPFVVDPDGKYEAEIKADLATGERVGIQHTPTIYVVSSASHGQPFVEVVDRSKLYSIIDQMKSEAGSASSKSSASKTTPKRPAKTTKIAKK